MNNNIYLVLFIALAAAVCFGIMLLVCEEDE